MRLNLKVVEEFVFWKKLQNRIALGLSHGYCSLFLCGSIVREQTVKQKG